MTAERWEQVERTYQSAMERDPVARAAFLDGVCASDPELRREVEALLENSSGADSFLERPAMELVARSMAAGSLRLTAGQRVAHYEIVEKLGEGGMGVVWKAEDLLLKRVVALKFLHDSDDQPRLLREAQVAASLNHPNICTVYEVNPEGGFLAMELVEGESLSETIAGRPLPVNQAVGLAIQICEGLKAAHDRGIIHRDIKSGNVLVTADGRAKILDFGLARAPGQAALTCEGIRAGTPGYMAPEQLRGEAVDRRTDIWAVGAVLHEMLTGRLPMGQTGALPEGVGRVARKALAADPKERYQRVEDMLADLRRASAAPAPRPSRGMVWRVGLAIGLIALALIGITYAVYWWRSRPSGIEWSQPRLIAHASGSPHSPSFSPDGGRIAYVNAVDGIDQVFVRQLDQAASTQLTSGNTPAASPRWSPKDDQILFSRLTVRGVSPEKRRQSLWSVPPRGGPALMITDDGRNPAFSPDGSKIVFERGSDIWMAAADGGNQRRLEGVPASDHLLADRTPSFSHDASWIAFFHPETGPAGDFWIMPAKGGQAKRLTFDVCQGSKPVWTRDDNWLLFASERSGVSALWSVPARGGKPQLVFGATGEDGDPDISLDGRQLIFTNTRSQSVLTLLNPATGDSRELVSSRSPMVYPMFNPEGQRIALFIEDREGKSESLYTVGLKGTDLSPVIRGESGRNTFPTWSGDGAHLYFYQSSPSHSFRRIRLDGGASSEVVAGWRWEVNYGARVDCREKYIVYSEAHAGVPVRTLIREISTGKERVLAQALDDPRWSRDGRLILGTDLSAAKQPEGSISVCPADGGACQQVAKGYLPVWSPDSGSIYFLSTGEFQDGAELWMIAASGGRARRVADLRPMWLIAQYYDVSPHGEVVFVQSRPGNRELWLAERR